MVENAELKKVVGENVARLRTQAGLTQTELAEKIGVTRVHVTRIETGVSSPSAEVLFALCDALKVSADSLRQIPVLST